jgi:hypothetical protein
MFRLVSAVAGSFVSASRADPISLRRYAAHPA